MLPLGLYVVSTKLSGFSVEIINTDHNMVICGIRVLLGSQDVNRTPVHVEVSVCYISYIYIPSQLCVVFMTTTPRQKYY